MKNPEFAAAYAEAEIEMRPFVKAAGAGVVHTDIDSPCSPASAEPKTKKKTGEAP